MDGILCHQGCYRYHKTLEPRLGALRPPVGDLCRAVGSRCYVDPRPGPVALPAVAAKRGGGITWRRTCSSTVAATGDGATSVWPASCGPRGTRSTHRP